MVTRAHEARSPGAFLCTWGRILAIGVLVDSLRRWREAIGPVRPGVSEDVDIDTQHYQHHSGLPGS